MSDVYAKLHNKHETDFSRYYFSDQNITMLQTNLQNTMSSKGYKTKRQCYNAVLSYMMNVYEIYANPKAVDLQKETNKINTIVLDKMTNILITEIKQHIGYIKDASTLPVPIDHPTHMTARTQLEYDSLI